MLKYVKGDLFSTDCDIIGHGCNCRGVMGSGVAKIVREKYPKAYNAYRELYEQDGLWLGDIQFVLQNDGKYVANCMTQDGYFPRHVVNVDYVALEKCMWELKRFAREKSLSIALPKIGAGLAGGDWNTIEEILNKVFFNYDVTVYCL